MSDKIYNIGIIGAGQLGSRHLQGLAKIELPCNLEVVDPVADSLKVAEERFLQIPANNNIKSIQYFDSISKMSNKQDLVVIATTANVRSDVIFSLTQFSQVQNLILEKVVFQSEKEFEDAEKLFHRHNTAAWVNCVRRVSPAYQGIKKYFVDNPIDKVKVTGGEWWCMGSNSLHFIDCIAYLGNGVEYSLDGSGLDQVVKESKRPGFAEFTGTLTGKFTNGIDFELVCDADSDLAVKVEISSENYDICVCETDKKYCVTNKQSGETQEFPFAVPFQSDLTNLTAREILVQGKCDLPTFQDSYKLHLPLLCVFNEHIAKIKGEIPEKCPIT